MPDQAAQAGSQESSRMGAVALSLDPAGQAPTVVAKGYGAVAEAIVQRAKEGGLYVHASLELVKLLMHVDLDARIPPSLYLAVAEMLTWIHGLETAENNTEPLKPSEFGES
jgi:flagellar biosynthesis protein